MFEKNGKRVIGFSEIKEKYLQHRYPMIMIDRITDYREREYIEGIKCVTGNSPELVGHFPERAIMPATNVVQGFAQLAIIFLKLSTGQLTDDEMTLVTSVKFRFLAPIFPGDTLEMTMKPKKLSESIGIFVGDARVNGRSVVRGELTLAKTSVSRFADAPW
jgi:3-hydroxyacyl-[acyl-carrier-protein] dehydratase